MSDTYLHPDLFTEKMLLEPNRKGFGEGLYEAGATDSSIVALTADLEESTQVEPFAKAYPERFIEIGVAEQNLVTVASGLAAVGKKPFVTSYASFSPGRNWEQIRTTICLNNRNVKIIGCHAGVSVGPDGATHQMLEDIALMRVLPNMTVVVPCDSNEARKATVALAQTATPGYLRLAREKTPIITAEDAPFELGKAYRLKSGSDVTILVCGPLLAEVLKAANQLHESISVEVINVPTVKPLDSKTILDSVKKTGKVITVEEGQAVAGLGGAVAELLAETIPTKLYRIGVNDRFGQSGTIDQLWKEYRLNSDAIIKQIKAIVKGK